MLAEPPLRYRRLAIVGASAPRRSEDAWARAAQRLGVDIRVFDALHRKQRIGPLAGPLIDRAVRRFDPDLVLCTRSAMRRGAPRLQRLFTGRPSVLWHVDARMQPGVLDLARLCDTVYTTCAGQREWYRDAGVANVRFLPQALDIDRDVPADTRPTAYECDVSFVGSGPYPRRWPVLAAVACMCRLQVRGPGWRGVVDAALARHSVH